MDADKEMDERFRCRDCGQVKWYSMYQMDREVCECCQQRSEK